MALRIATGSYPNVKFIPVIVEGVYFDSNMVSSVTHSLLNRRAYVNESITASQLSNGTFIVFIDGLSEIRSELDDEFATKQLLQFVSDHPDTHLVITSRNPVPESIVDALGLTSRLTLLDLDESTEISFVRKYLQRPDDAEEFVELVRRKSPLLPRIPLMLRLLTETYNTTGTVPRDRSTLFASYLAQILRPESTGIKALNGVQYAIRQLVRNTYLSVRGERRGFFEEDGIKTLSTLRQDLADRDVTISPNALLNVLVHAGLFRYNNSYYTFFHDSFESYYAACALERDIRRRELELPTACFGSPHLSETWRFVEELFTNAADRSFLASIVNELEKGRHVKTTSE